MRPELHDGRDDLGRNLREFGDERRGKRLLDLRLVFSEAAGALDLEQVLDFRVHAAAAAATLRRVDADAAVEDWFDVKTTAELQAAEPKLAEQYRGMSILTMVLHRLARIIEYATPRYDVTLYLDDDMYACPGVEPLLGAALLDLAATAESASWSAGSRRASSTLAQRSRGPSRNGYMKAARPVCSGASICKVGPFY